MADPETALGAEVGLAAVQGAAADADGDAGLVQLLDRLVVADGVLECVQLGVDPLERVDLGADQDLVLGVRPAQLEDEATEVAVPELADPAEVAQPTPHPAAVADADLRRSGGRLGRAAVGLRGDGRRRHLRDGRAGSRRTGSCGGGRVGGDAPVGEPAGPVGDPVTGEEGATGAAGSGPVRTSSESSAASAASGSSDGGSPWTRVAASADAGVAVSPLAGADGSDTDASGAAAEAGPAVGACAGPAAGVSAVPNAVAGVEVGSAAGVDATSAGLSGASDEAVSGAEAAPLGGAVGSGSGEDAGVSIASSSPRRWRMR